MFPKQTNSTLNGVLGMMSGSCRMMPVLARLILWLCLCVSAVAADQKPNVILMVSDTGEGISARKKLDAIIDENADGEGVKWRQHQVACRVSPGRSATLSALLYGKQALTLGVVSDYDWRRKPIPSISLANQLAKAGYHTLFCGAWLMGRESPYHASERGFEGVRYGFADRLPIQSMNRLDEPWKVKKISKSPKGNLSQALELFEGKNKPVYAVISDSLMLPMALLPDEFNKLARSQQSTSQRDTVIVLVCINTERRSQLRGRVPDQYHYPGEISLYHFGKEARFMAAKEEVSHARTDWELYHVLLQMIVGENFQKPEFRVFHKASWNVNESPDKYRHRGSLVVGKGHALVDGLQLYPATKKMLPDMTKPLDISKHQKLHGDMLAAHAKWWAQARPALHNPRPFSVGKKDNVAVKLTALDWRPSKVIHADGTSPVSQPLVYQQDLLGILRGIQDEKYRRNYPAHSGSWSVNIMKPGRYQITASLLPANIDDERKKLSRLRGGRAFIRLGKNLVELQVAKGATSITVQTDADPGVTDLECWFTGQLALERELGAFFVEIQRVGDKKFDIKARP